MEPSKPSTAKIAAALARAQGKFTTPKKSKTVDFTDNKGKRVYYKYADLADLIDCVKGPLSENELAVSHSIRHVGKEFMMLTSLHHSSGEILSTWYPLVDPMQLRPQEFGSELTYARRYSLSCLLGVASEEDDDGNGHDADKKKGVPPAKSNPPSQAAKPNPATAESPSGLKPKSNATPNVKSPEKPKQDCTDAQLKRLFTIADEKNWTKEGVKQFIFEKWNLESTRQLTVPQYNELVTTIETGIGST